MLFFLAPDAGIKLYPNYNDLVRKLKDSFNPEWSIKSHVEILFSAFSSSNKVETHVIPKCFTNEPYWK